MSDGQWSPSTGTGQIVVSGLTKHYKNVRAVDNLSFTVEPGRVTGFLGPNGAGKTTTLRMLLNLVTPTSGDATVDGVRYADLTDPLRHVGAVLEASSAHKGRTGLNHLRVICAAAGLPRQRADEALALVGLTPAARRKFKGYSLGMKQRLGIAAAMLGDPRVLILDEPANGLDPAGIRWMRDLLRGFANKGGTVLLSSHLLHEIEVIADDLVVIGNGTIVASGTKEELLAAAGTFVRSTSPRDLAHALEQAGIPSTLAGDGSVRTDADPALVGVVALDAGIALTELRSAEGAGLEDMFLSLTADTQREGVAA
jgi:ABC-2 type transport system ATP-binding protein